MSADKPAQNSYDPSSVSWNGFTLKWDDTKRHFQASPDKATLVTAWPTGIEWTGSLVYNGNSSGNYKGRTIQEALDRALKIWLGRSLFRLGGFDSRFTEAQVIDHCSRDGALVARADREERLRLTQRETELVQQLKAFEPPGETSLGDTRKVLVEGVPQSIGGPPEEGEPFLFYPPVILRGKEDMYQVGIEEVDLIFEKDDGSPFLRFIEAESYGKSVYLGQLVSGGEEKNLVLKIQCIVYRKVKQS